jgi:thiamine kinase-like enzyme
VLLSLEDAIARVPQWAGAKDLKTTPLGGGITNQNFRVDVDGESFVLRICGANTELLGIRREAEYIANLAAGQLGIAPEVFYLIQPESYLVTRFVNGRPVPPEEMVKPDNIRRVAEALKKIHALPLQIPATFSPFRRVEHLTEVSRRYNVAFPVNFDWLMERMREVEAAFLTDPFIPRPCHDDLLNGNFLDDGQIRILDWEYAGMGDIYFDLANFSSHHRFDDNQAHFLLECYFGQSTPKRFARLELMRPMSELHEAMWGTTQVGLSKLDFDFRGYADLWFGRATVAIHDPRWGDWLKEIAHG